MGAPRIEYAIVGRYMNEKKEVIAYELQSIEASKSGRYTREQVAYLVGRGQVTNCEGQIYGDKLLLRGVGMNLNDLPVIYSNGKSRNMDLAGHQYKDNTTAETLNQVMITKVIRFGRNVIGYEIQNIGGQTKNINREQAISLALQKRIGNAIAFKSGDGYMLRAAKGYDLSNLPVLHMNRI